MSVKVRDSSQTAEIEVSPGVTGAWISYSGVLRGQAEVSPASALKLAAGLLDEVALADAKIRRLRDQTTRVKSLDGGTEIGVSAKAGDVVLDYSGAIRASVQVTPADASRLAVELQRIATLFDTDKLSLPRIRKSSFVRHKRIGHC